MVCFTVSPAAYLASVIEKKDVFIVSPISSLHSRMVLRICSRAALLVTAQQVGALTAQHRGRSGLHGRKEDWPTERNRMFSASAFFLSRAWPLVAPTRRIFMIANTVTVGATVYLAPDPDMIQASTTIASK